MLQLFPRSNICKSGFANHCWWTWILGLFQAFKEDNICQISYDALSDLINHHDRWHQARFSHFDKVITQTVKVLREINAVWRLLIGSVVWPFTKHWTHLWKWLWYLSCLQVSGWFSQTAAITITLLHLTQKNKTLPQSQFLPPHSAWNLIQFAAKKNAIFERFLFHL